MLDAPPGTELLLSSPASPHGGFRYDFPAMSVQVHPELSPGYLRGLLEGNAVTAFPPDLVSQALATLGPELDSQDMAEGFARFFRESGRPGPA